jgi:hypothetical protein
MLQAGEDGECSSTVANLLLSGSVSAAVELRRLLPLITDTMQARECARAIAGWKPLPGTYRDPRR